MLELGSSEIEFHEKILSDCCDHRIGLVGLAGERFLTAAKNMNLIKANNIIDVDDAEILARKIVKRLKFNDVVLVKGRCVMKMEKVVNAIKAMNIHVPSQ
ncbi:hypothetical protein Dsin_009576 [Dipteronia sinensis]|uniref:Uncharacterized protein n=1 Tax=Dipteronia sinensis TaxID=43782 RepID=A0AAE0AQS9_9ROSI|nr:hypothetical protein Dsin_033045 [Dipteronia sinensis]KAK3222551.1 hypothetical protein Dsin_009576 [Dipteronia sinensis]